MILEDLFESNMSELDIEYQDWLHSRGRGAIGDKEFERSYGMTRREWAIRNREWIANKQARSQSPDDHLYPERQGYRPVPLSNKKFMQREGAEDYAGIYSPEAIALGKKFCEFYNITEDTDVQLAVEIIDSYIDQFKRAGQPIDLKIIKSGVVDAFRQVYRGLGPGPNFRKKFQNRLDEKTIEENLRKWFKEKWVRFGPDGKIRGACARGSESEGKPKCLPQAKAHALGKKGRASAAAKKRREDPNPERQGAAKNVATKVREGAMKDLHTELADKYRELAPSIEKYKDSFLAGQLYDALEAIAVEHGAEQELRRMMNSARNRAHMDYDTNPGGFHNWFWYLPFADESDLEEGILGFDEDIKNLQDYIKEYLIKNNLKIQELDNVDVRRISKEYQLPVYQVKNVLIKYSPNIKEEQLDEKQDACYHKVKSRYKVWPSAYASGALVQCRKKGAANWGKGSKKK